MAEKDEGSSQQQGDGKDGRECPVGRCPRVAHALATGIACAVQKGVSAYINSLTGGNARQAYFDYGLARATLRGYR